MTTEIIIAQLNRISADASYDIIGNTICLTINDFEGFDETWSEIERELVNADAVEEVIEWLEANADSVKGNLCRYYHFGEIVVKVEYASADI